MKKVSLIIAVIVLMLAVFTNPKQDQHKEVLKTKFNTFMQKSMQENIKETDNEWEQAGQSLGLMLGGALINTMVDNMISSTNCIIFSITKMNYEGDSKPIGIGIFGNIFFFNDIDKLLSESMNS